MLLYGIDDGDNDVIFFVTVIPLLGCGVGLPTYEVQAGVLLCLMECQCNEK